MNLPKIDTAALPDLTELVGMFGSHNDDLMGFYSEDGVVVIMVFIYEVLLPYW